MNNIWKYIIVWIIWLILTALLWYFVYNTHYDEFQWTDWSVFAIIPNEFTQILHINFDEKIKWFIDEAPTDVSWITDFSSIMQYLISVTAYQYNEISFIIFDTKWKFTIDDAINIWLVNEAVWYDYRNISWNKYIYWDVYSLDFFDNYNWSNLLNNSKLNKYLLSLINWNNNMWLISKSDQYWLSQQWLNAFLPYLEDLSYTVVLSSLWLDKSVWSVNVLFQNEINLASNYLFNSNVFDSIKSSNLASLQIWSISDMIWVDAALINMIWPRLLNDYFTEMWIILSDSVYSELIKAITGDLLFALSKWENEIWFGIRVASENLGLYNWLRSFMPYINNLFFELWLGWEISTFENDDNYWLSFNIPFLWQYMIESDIKIYSEWNKTYIDLFSPIFDWDKINLNSTNSTILTYYINMGNLFNVLSPFWWGQLVWLTNDEFDFFKEKIIYWDISVNRDNIEFTFTLE